MLYFDPVPTARVCVPGPEHVSDVDIIGNSDRRGQSSGIGSNVVFIRLLSPLIVSGKKWC